MVFVDTIARIVKYTSRLHRSSGKRENYTLLRNITMLEE